jgi:uncharacterized cupin superfamily protein
MEGDGDNRGMPNILEPEWDADQDKPPFTWRRARIGRQAGSEQLGASLYEAPRGCSTFPLHFHHANEELLLVVAGRPTLRTLDEARAGRRRGRRLPRRSRRRSPHRQPKRGARARARREHDAAAELNEYPDSGKAWARSYAPGGERDPEAVELIARPEENLDYMEGER